MAGKNKGSEQQGKGGQPQREQGAGQSREGGQAAPPVRQPAQEVGKQRPDERNR